MAKLAVVLLLLSIAVYECTAINSVCRLPRVTGPCRAAIRRYYYDTRSRKCLQFIFGGCRGNGNNFRTLQECRRTCTRVTRCPPKMIFNSCGTMCPSTCANPNPRICTRGCRRGCFCRKGLLLFRGRCVRPNQCPKTTRCPPGMIFNSCGTMCPKTCANPNPRICTKGCRRGCFCRKGLLLFRGRCVRRNQCPRTRCTGGRVYKTCERRCRTTCANRKVRCRRRRCRRGCFCPRPRVWHRGRCVKLSQCRKTITRCPPKMIFNSCGTMCPRTCANPNPRICTRGCKRGCFCRKGLLLFKGRCVRRRQCPKITRCPPKMIFNSCGTMCPRTCANPNPRICTKGCRRGCFCRKGLLLFKGRCVRRRQCPKKSSICSLSPVRGRCKGRIPRYYFNRQFRSCVRFSYSGCGGNKNNFLTVGQCLRACGPRQNQDLLSTDLASEESEDDPDVEESEDDLAIEESEDDLAAEESEDDLAAEESEDDPAAEESEDDLAAEESEDDPAVEEHDDIDSQVEEVDEDENFPEEELEKESFF